MIDIKDRTKTLHLTVAFVSLLLFIPFLGNVHLFDWDEINFAEAAREMLVTGDWLRVHIDYAPFWEKPPLFIWLQAIAMSVFGVNEFAARLPNALIGVATLQILLYLGRKIHSLQFGLWWVLAYVGSFLPHFYFKSGIIDPLFNLSIFLAVYFLCKALKKESAIDIVYAGIATGIAVLTKGPVGFLLPSMVGMIMLLWQRNISMFVVKSIIMYLCVSLLVSLLWFGVEYSINGSWFIEEFIRYQLRLLTTGDAGHSQPFYYHFVVVLIGCFPASIYAIFGFRRAWKNDTHSFSQWMIVLFFTVMILFSIVQTKIVHYSSLAYYPVTYLAAFVITQFLEKRSQKTSPFIALYSLLNIVWIGLFTALWYIGTHIDFIISITKRDFEKANLSAPVVWSGYEVIVPCILVLGFIASILFMRRTKYVYSIVSGFVAVIIAITIFLPLVAPKVEGYTQRSILEFYQQTSGEDCYVQPIFYKTYSHLFYGNRKYSQSPASKNMTSGEFEEWLKFGAIDKPAYFIAKLQDKHHLDDIENAQYYGSYYGFIVYKRAVQTMSER
jgi:4-amino-4-deoxy-L-arabinose transferase-like glycosyltransferase